MQKIAVLVAAMLVSACVQSAPRQAGPEAAALAPILRVKQPRSVPVVFDPEVPHGADMDGRTVILPAGSEAVTPEEQVAESATVDRVLNAFRFDALPYVGSDYRIVTTVVLDPNLVGEESRRAEPGLCYTASHTVVLNRDLWRSYGEAEREVVLYHELGHCELGRRHVAGQRLNGGPVSLMNRNSVAGVDFFVTDRDYYVHELFTARQAPARFILHSSLMKKPHPDKG